MFAIMVHPSAMSFSRTARLNAALVACSDCGRHFDVLRAGRCLDAPALHLEPVPLLVDGSGLIKIALGAAA